MISARMKCFVVTAGMKGVVSECIKMLANQKEVSNIEETMVLCATEEEYDREGKLSAFVEPILTPFNKSLLFTPERYPALKKFRGAVVMGDLVEDLAAVRAVPLETVLSIGFDNFNVPEVTAKMCAEFDIVVKNDGTLEPATEILSYIAGPEEHVTKEKDWLSKILY